MANDVKNVTMPLPSGPSERARIILHKILNKARSACEKNIIKVEFISFAFILHYSLSKEFTYNLLKLIITALITIIKIEEL